MMDTRQGRELAIRINGLDLNKQSTLTQPPIKDKQGQPYDLDDPILPVVKDHQFRIRYWQMPKTPAFYFKYLEEHWDYFNKTRFGGKMKRPSFGLLKDVDALSMKLRGRYRPMDNLLELSPNLFNAPHEGWLNRTLIHEMCHQYVWEVHGSDVAREDGRKTKGHGPLWATAMRMAGLPPSRFDDTSNEMFFDKKEEKKHKPVIDFRAAFRELQRTHLKASAVPFAFVKFAESGGAVSLGMVACESLKKRGHYWTIYRRDNTWWRILLSPGNMFWPLREDEQGEDARRTDWVRAANNLANEKLERSE
jgi:hypothetical protein